MAEHSDLARDLRLGAMALERGRIDREQLIAALRAWLQSEGRPLAEVLTAQGASDRTGQDATGSLLGAAEPSPGDGSGSGPWATVAYVGSAVAEETDDPGGQPADPAGAAGGGRFRILRPHARGGLGEVFLALDPDLNRIVALKGLRPHHAYDPARQARFLLEAEVTGRLEHPGIVPIYALGRHADGRPYYAMRFIEGETLRVAIERFHRPERPSVSEAEGRELAFRRLLRSLIDACNAVAYAHSRGVIHRDLKPENIMLGRFGETLVVDWGIAKPLAAPEPDRAGRADLLRLAEEASMTLPGAVLGTPQYMSPEQAAGDLDRVGPASDVYSLGATLYCLLVGHSPFPDGDVATVLERVRRGIFPSPRRLRRTVDPALEAVCLKAMASGPGDRFASPLELAHELEAWLADVRYRREQERALVQAKRSLARLCFERAHACFDRRGHGEGLLWLSRALEEAPPEPPTLRRVARASLAGWHAGAQLEERCFGHGREVQDLAFSPEGHRLATACADGTARLWDVATGARLTPLMRHEGAVSAVAFSPDGTLLATAGRDGTVRRWDALTGASVGRPGVHEAPVVAVGFGPDGATIATASRSGAPCLWDAATGEPLIGLEGDGVPVRAIAFSPDGARLAAADEDGRVWTWDLATRTAHGEPLRHDAAVTDLAFGPDGQQLLTGCRDGKVTLWDLGRRAKVAELAHEGEVVCARFLPGGKALATACHDGTARLWDAAGGRPTGEPLAHRARVHVLACSPDGQLVATGSEDRTSRLWDTATGLPIGPPLGHDGPVRALAFSPDGLRLATGGDDGMARCWRIPAPVEGDAERISCWVRVVANLEFDEGDAIRRLDGLTGWELRRRLTELGGPPVR